MPPSRSQPFGAWTWDDHQDNERRIQKAADRKLWDRLGRMLGVRGRDLGAALGRLIDDRIASTLRSHPTALIEQLTNPDQAGALRGPIVDLILDDVTELMAIFMKKDKTNDTRPKKTR